MGKKRLQQPVIDPSLSIKAVTKGSVWAISEKDVIRMWKEATRDAEVKKNVNHYLDIFKSAFIIEEIKEDVTLVRKNYEQRGYKVAQIIFDEMMMFTWAIKKKSITHVTDLTYENIGYISTTELLEVLNRNFGGGWEWERHPFVVPLPLFNPAADRRSPEDLHKSADMIHGNVGESEGLGLGHAAAGYLGDDINQFAAHLNNGSFAPQHGTEVNVHVVLHHAVSALVGSHLQHGSDGIARRCAPTCCEDDGLTVEEIETMMSQVECRLVRFDKNDVYALAGSPCRYADIIIEGELTARMVGPSGKFVQMAARGIGTLTSNFLAKKVRIFTLHTVREKVAIFLRQDLRIDMTS